VDQQTNLNSAIVEGFIFKVDDLRKIKGDKHIQTFYLTDYTNSIRVTRFENKANTLDDMNAIKKGNCWVRVLGSITDDSYAKEVTMKARSVEIIPSKYKREDTASEKRVELHTHSKMTAMDGIANVSDYVKRAAEWGHKAVAITDRGNVQGFPEAQLSSSKLDIKMIYGMEMNVVDPDTTIVTNEKDMPLLDSTYVSFDLETTGLSFYHDRIIEFGAVKIKSGQVIDRMQTFINPELSISEHITNLTNISNDDVDGAPTFKEIYKDILKFFDDCILVAHNAKFDIGFLNMNLARIGENKIENPIIDTLPFSHAIIEKPLKSYNLGSVCRYYHTPYSKDVAHRADYDAEVLSNALNMMIHDMANKDLFSLLDINKLPLTDTYKYPIPYHCNCLVMNQVGLKNLFRLVSESSTKYFYREARIPKELLEKYHEGLLYGSGCYNSDVFQAALYDTDEKIDELIQFYDYIEIQPLEDYVHLIDSGKMRDFDNIIVSIKRLIKAAKKYNKIIVATSDCHFLDPKDKVYHDVYILNLNIGIGGTSHPLANRSNPDARTPNSYFRSTNEMLECYPYLDEQETYEIVVTNTNKIADMIDNVKVIHSKLYPPKIEGADEKLTKICHETAKKMYGDPVPEIVQQRLDKELSNIIKHGFGVIYYIAHKLVKKSNDDGYVVGSRGSVGSSFVATMAGITEVNPLPPHYRCPKCGHNEFLEEGVIEDGYDLESKVCPVCGSQMLGDGHNIPFETFLGFNGDKVPDIDLNFSGEYQSTAHNFCKEIFGEERAYRAGTILTVADKTAYGYAQGYFERLGKDETVRKAELERIATGIAGVKRSTGAHAGGVIVIPSDLEVYDFTPYQFPADDMQSSWKTTHFDFHAIHDNVLKFDILGHDDPTVTRELQDLTGVDPKTIPTNDKKVMSIFTSPKELGCDLSIINVKNGALGLPEFGTEFVRGMLDATSPKCFNDLVIISGLSHGTDVYLGNAETLIKNGTCTLSEVIGCRDDIMVRLIEMGLPNKDAFDIMECVRKGKSPEVFPKKNYEELMKKHDVPQWYIDSCKKIKYMFPKAHAVAYVLSAIRISWWKVYYPREYYAVFFTIRAKNYNIQIITSGKARLLSEVKELIKLQQELGRLPAKEANLKNIYSICIEMIERGYHFNKISLEKSHATKFILDPDDDKGILPPFTSIDSLGESVANSVIDARIQQPFLSVEDVTKRTRLTKNQIEILNQMGVFEGMQSENQISLF
jgi:DNA polymerase-3 subunit alpha (Gram-positive type)